MSSGISRDVIMLIIQFLDEEKFKDSLHSLERESGVFFNMKYFEDSVMKEEWDNVEKYLLGFTKIEDNRHSVKIFFNIRKQKYLEALENCDIRTLFVDHTCGQPNGPRTALPITNPLIESIPRAMQEPLGPSIGGWMGNVSLAPHEVVPAANNAAYDPKYTLETAAKPVALQVNNPLVKNILPVAHQGQSVESTLGSPDDFPKTVIATLNQGSDVQTIDFHPLQQTLLLVGTNIGDFAIWKVITSERLALRNFKVWELDMCSMALQVTLADEYAASVNKVLWSPDGALLGTKSSNLLFIHIVQGLL